MLEYFSYNELLLLIYFLDILIVEEENKEILLGFLNLIEKKELEADLMSRYKDILYYIMIRNQGNIL